MSDEEPTVLVALTQSECAWALGRLDPSKGQSATCALYEKVASAWLELRRAGTVEHANAHVAEARAVLARLDGAPGD